MAAFLDSNFLQSLLDVEVALAAAEAEAGVIPVSAVADIRAVARAELFDPTAIAEAALRDGNVLIPLVRALTDLVAKRSVESARHVHRGATSQDIIDCAVVLHLRTSQSRIHDHLTGAMRSCAALARAHAATPMAGRTWLQHASPTSFGLKAAGWLDMIGRCRSRLGDAVGRAQVLQLGGASGTLASLGSAGPAVEAAMAKHLSLDVPAAPWHTHRDRIVDASAAFGMACGALGKVGRDLTLLAQSEVAEAAEHPEGGGGSSSMPHKHNPVRAVRAVAAAIQAPGLVSTMLAAMVQEHERAAGAWQAEWQTLADLMRVTADSASSIAEALSELRIDPLAMRRHLDLRGGVAMAEALTIALLPHIGRKEAMTTIERVVRHAEQRRGSLRDSATSDSQVTRYLSAAEIERALAPESFLGSAEIYVRRVLQAWGM